MSQSKGPLWRFFASVKLALILLIILACTSILGTLIKQGQTPEYYVNVYGAKLAGLFEMMGLTSMYSSWWYIALLVLFALNLIVCSFERLPSVWRQVTRDNLAEAPAELAKLACSYRITKKIDPPKAAERIIQTLQSAGWKKIQRLEQSGSTLMFVQKGAWSGFGVYLVHLSILVILAGAIIGRLFGFQAYVFIPEGRTTSNIFLRETQEPMPLDFRLRNDRFEKTFYPNGQVKSYRAALTVIDPERQTPYRKTIVVNDPLSYKGITFYMGDSYPTEQFLVKVENQTTGRQQSFRAPAEQTFNWPDMDFSFIIENPEFDEEGAIVRTGVTFTSGAADNPANLQLTDNSSKTFEHGGQRFTLSFRQLQSTLLLVKRDPGIATVYSGCVLLVIGLVVSFFFAHRRLWFRISPGDKKGALIEVGGISNKNRLGFEQTFNRLTGRIKQNLEQKST
jgi:cytochrome c biogenesis protein